MSPNEEPAEPIQQPDRDSQEDVTPFTDFGQFGYGHIDLRVLDQDIYWVDITGAPHFLVDMSEDYRRNVITFLYRRAPEWWQLQILWDGFEVGLRKTFNPEDPSVDGLLKHAATLRRLGPSQWLEATPLLRQLRRLTSGP